MTRQLCYRGMSIILSRYDCLQWSLSKPNFHQIWITMEKSLMKWALCLLSVNTLWSRISTKLWSHKRDSLSFSTNFVFKNHYDDRNSPNGNRPIFPVSLPIFICVCLMSTVFKMMNKQSWWQFKTSWCSCDFTIKSLSKSVPLKQNHHGM